MTKVDIVSSVYEKVGFSKKEAVRVVETIFDIVKEALGNFVVRSKRARRGRNPQTGDDIKISSRKILTFKPSQVLKNDLNR
jgi:integration host factor subunit alpha